MSLTLWLVSAFGRLWLHYTRRKKTTRCTPLLCRGWDEERRYSARIPPRRRRRVSRIDGRKREKNGSKVAVVGLLGSLTVGQMRAPHQGRTKNLLNISAISLRRHFAITIDEPIINHEYYKIRSWEKYPFDRREGRKENSWRIVCSISRTTSALCYDETIFFFRAKEKVSSSRQVSLISLCLDEFNNCVAQQYGATTSPTIRTLTRYKLRACDTSWDLEASYNGGWKRGAWINIRGTCFSVVGIAWYNCGLP